MKSLKTLSSVFAVIGILLMVAAVAGKVMYDPYRVFGTIVPGGMSPASAMLGANVFLLLAVLANSYRKE